MPVLVDFVAIEAGNDVPWVLLGMNPVYLNRVGNPSNLDVSQIVEIAFLRSQKCECRLKFSLTCKSRP